MATIMPIERRFFALIALCAAALIIPAAPAASPAPAQDRSPQSPQPSLAVVTGDNVLVRSGAADSYYPFGRLSRGTIVELIGEKFNWARVATRGPAFAAGTRQGEFFGHIIYPQTETGRFRLNPDGRSGVTLGRMDVLAPNLNTNFNPNDSWKPLIRLEPDTTVRILSTTTASNNTVHLIALPDGAEGWVSKAHLREATAEEVAAWRQSRSPRADAPATAPKETEAKPEPKPAAREPREQVKPATVEREQRAEEKPAAVEAERRAEEMPAAVEREVAQREPERAAAVEQVQDAPSVSPSLPAQPVLAREETASPAPEPEKGGRATVVRELANATMEDLEVLLVKMRNAPTEISEVNNLRQMYQEFAARHANDRTIARFAKARAEQLEIWRDVRERQAELARIRERSRRTGEQAEMALLTIHAHADYDAIGRLTASTIYDGQRLPKMLRLQEPGTNRTLAYVVPEGHGFEMIEMLGLWLGVVGERSYDPALRLNIITPRRIDLLAPRQ